MGTTLVLRVQTCALLNDWMRMVEHSNMRTSKWLSAHFWTLKHAHCYYYFVIMFCIIFVFFFQPAYVVHIFPSCDFVNENLRRIAPSLLERVADIAHLLIVITTVWSWLCIVFWKFIVIVTVKRIIIPDTTSIVQRISPFVESYLEMWRL